MEEDSKYRPLYDQALEREYPFVKKLRETVSRSFDELMVVFPAPAPVETNPEIAGSSGPVSGTKHTGTSPPTIHVSQPSDQEEAAAP